MSKNKIFVVSGPGGVGKGTIIRELLKIKKLDLVRGLNVTTRRPRATDKNDPHFIFVNKKQFEDMIHKGEILEYNLLDNEYYGANGPSLYQQLKNHNILIEVDINGGIEIKKKINDVVLIFLTAKFKDLKQRILARGDTSQHHLKYRMKLAKTEMAMAKYYDYVVKNPQGHPEKATQEVERIIAKELKKD